MRWLHQSVHLGCHICHGIHSNLCSLSILAIVLYFQFPMHTFTVLLTGGSHLRFCLYFGRRLSHCMYHTSSNVFVIRRQNHQMMGSEEFNVHTTLSVKIIHCRFGKGCCDLFLIQFIQTCQSTIYNMTQKVD